MLSPNHLFCCTDKAICGSPGSIFYVFGTRFVEGTLEGSNVTYSCAQGLALIGDVTRTCLSNGEWSGSVPTCSGKPMQCFACVFIQQLVACLIISLAPFDWNAAVSGTILAMHDIV